MILMLGIHATCSSNDKYFENIICDYLHYNVLRLKRVYFCARIWALKQELVKRVSSINLFKLIFSKICYEDFWLIF